MKLAHRTQSTLALICGCAALTLVVPGCGDDDDSTGATGGKSSTGGKAGSTGGATTATGGRLSQGGSTPGQGGKAGGQGGATPGQGGGTTVTGGATATGGVPGMEGGAGAGGVPTTGSGGTSSGGTSSGGTGTGGTLVTGGSGGDMGGTDMGGAGGEAGSGTTGPKSMMLFDFETDAQGWGTTGAGTTVAASSDKAFNGAQSLKINLPALDGGTNDNGDSRIIQVGALDLYPGAVVTLHVWTPAGTEPLYVQAVTQGNNWATWNTGAATLTRGDWSTWNYTVPNNFPGGLQNFAIQVGVPKAGTFPAGAIYLDAITAVQGPAVCAGTGTGAYGWETASDALGWKSDSGVVAVSQSTTQHQGATGTGALKLALTALPVTNTSGADNSVYLYLEKPNVFCGQTISFNIWTPAGSDGIKFAGYVSYNGYGSWKDTAPDTITRGDWTTFTLAVPDVGPKGVQRIGLKISSTASGPFTGDLFLDNVTW